MTAARPLASAVCAADDLHSLGPYEEPFSIPFFLEKGIFHAPNSTPSIAFSLHHFPKRSVGVNNMHNM